VRAWGQGRGVVGWEVRGRGRGRGVCAGGAERTRAEEEFVRARWVNCVMRGAAFATDE
jgi:hypothetical protein